MVANIEWFKKRLAILPWFSSQPVHFLHIYGLQSAEEILCHSYRFAFCNLLDILVFHEKSYAVMTLFFFFFHFPSRCLIFMFEGNVGSVDPTWLISSERFWSILFSSDIFRRRKFTIGKDFQCSQTKVPNSGPKTNNVQNSGRYQLLQLYQDTPNCSNAWLQYCLMSPKIEYGVLFYYQETLWWRVHF